MDPHATIGRFTTTTGTSGEPLKIPWSAKYSDFVIGQRIRRAVSLGILPWNRVAIVQTSGVAISGSLATRNGDPIVSLSRVLVGSFNVEIPSLIRSTFGLGRVNLEEVTTAIGNFRPYAIYARPSHLIRIGRTLRQKGIQISPKVILSVGEFLSRAVRSEIFDLFGAEIYDSYGCKEMGTIAIEC